MKQDTKSGIRIKFQRKEICGMTQNEMVQSDSERCEENKSAAKNLRRNDCGMKEDIGDVYPQTCIKKNVEEEEEEEENRKKKKDRGEEREDTSQVVAIVGG
jgi:hypothetical protein